MLSPCSVAPVNSLHIKVTHKPHIGGYKMLCTRALISTVQYSLINWGGEGGRESEEESFGKSTTKVKHWNTAVVKFTTLVLIHWTLQNSNWNLQELQIRRKIISITTIYNSVYILHRYHTNEHVNYLSHFLPFHPFSHTWPFKHHLPSPSSWLMFCVASNG